ncbi:tyrosine-type recombinase/integrase [Martelella mediterranea]|uniref:tyrosine-type recombinase/integrase n=1 Tax=Martelella mediterranea TaxID=293089 RepID=UPI001E44EB04|nr:tyrosine-type recombinase/integrase [Martelella mediterranea]
MAHVQRRRRLTTHGPIEYHGRLILKERTAFKRARTLAGLDEAVTPHVLRHTCATWQRQRGEDIWAVAGFLGTSAKVISETYGHHSPEHLKTAKRRFRGPKLDDQTEKGESQ